MGWNGRNKVLTEEQLERIEKRIKKQTINPKISYWDKDKVGWLINNYSNSSIKSISEKFPNRTYPQIKRKARTIGLKRNFNESHTNISKFTKEKHRIQTKKYWVGLTKEEKQKHCNAISKSNKGKKIGLLQRLKLRKSKLGKLNPQYVNGLYCRKAYGAIRNLKEYSEWRLMIFGRDDFTCQECGKRGIYFEAHHKKPYIKIFKDFLDLYSGLDSERDIDKLLILAMGYIPFWDLNNGITLCRDCHNLTKKKKVPSN